MLFISVVFDIFNFLVQSLLLILFLINCYLTCVLKLKLALIYHCDWISKKFQMQSSIKNKWTPNTLEKVETAWTILLNELQCGNNGANHIFYYSNPLSMHDQSKIYFVTYSAQQKNCGNFNFANFFFFWRITDTLLQLYIGIN
jgi:carboxypeptidase C (cathepsin A)